MLRHTQDCSNPAHQERQERCNTDRQLALLVPLRPIIAASRSSKNYLFLYSDGDPDCHPITHEGKKVGKDITEMVTASKGAHSVDDDTKTVPYDTRDLLCCSAEYLEVDTTNVCGGDDIGNETQGDDNTAELAEAVKRIKSSN